jgi:hypothetical protein
MRWIIGGSWAAFAFLLLVLGQQFLYACGIHIGPYAWRACPAQSDWLNDTREIREGDRLQSLVHTVELRLAAKPPCEPPPPTDEQLVRDAGGQKGRLEVFLRWDTLDDLDLVVDCPGGTIGGVNNSDGPGVCADGHREVDSNKNLTEHIRIPAVEHVAWQNPPRGNYKFRAQLYKPKNGSVEQDIPFRMTFKFDGKEKVCDGTVAFYPQAAGIKGSDGNVLSSRAAAIRWRMGDSLPSCDWEVVESHFCSPGQCEKN